MFNPCFKVCNGPVIYSLIEIKTQNLYNPELPAGALEKSRASGI